MRLILFIILFLPCSAYSQTTITFDEDGSNKMYIKLYGHVDYNQKLESGKRHAGKMDVHRLVTLFGYQFNRKTQFVSEIEVEHAKEIFIEQAFVKHRLSKGINLKAGLILVPMGFINEMHEPTFFYTVERPLLDKIIVPSTWREIGAGITGLFPRQSLKYQLYLINNPISYNGSGTINGSQGIRGGRQKGAKSIVTSLPGLAGQLEYFGWDGIKLGLSLYHGKTNTSLYSAFPDKSVENSQEIIDSSSVLLSMAAIHSSFDRNNWTARFQYVVSHLGAVDNYNVFTGSDAPVLMHGFYALLAYDFIANQKVSLSPFVRFSHLDNHLKVTDNMERNNALRQNIISLGVNYKPDPGVVFKIDYEFYSLGDGSNFRQFNTGVGVWF